MLAVPLPLPIELDRVSVAVGRLAILDGVSLSFAAGEPTVLVGPNGSGKTTLLRLAMGLLKPTGGRILWGGGPAEATRKRRAIVFQRPAMLRRSAAGNIRYALRAAGVAGDRRRARTEELMALVGLDGLGDRPARRLSGGEQQRLALARALAMDPALLFLDEPTASLDPAQTKAVEGVIRSAAGRGIKVVMATHDLGEAKRLAGEIVMLDRGRVVETAPASEFFERPQSAEARAFLAGELLV